MNPADAPAAEIRVADVVFDVRDGGSQAIFTYAAQTGQQPGDLVLAPLTGRPLPGVVARVYSAREGDLDFPLTKLRPVECTVEGASLPAPLFELAAFVAKEYLSPLPAAFGAAMPPGIGTRLVSTWQLQEPELLQFDLELTPLQIEILEFAREQRGELRMPASGRWPANYARAVRLLEVKGILRRRTCLEPPEEEGSGPELFRLSADDERIQAFLDRQSAKKPAQALTLVRLMESDRGPLTMADIQALSGVTQNVVKALATAGLLEKVDASTLQSRAAPTPNPEQRLAIDAIVDAMKEGRPQGFLLFGVTGSGKTEVYLRAAAEALKAGKQILYLVPEIALATQAIGQLRARFGTRATVLHSELSPRERLVNWMNIAEGRSPLVLGARSALFAPLSNLGLIVMDEEHEGSYKQESSPRYHARHLVRFLAKRHGCPFVLGSATPSLEAFQAAEQEDLTLLSLPRRAAHAQLPEVFVEDLGSGFRQGRPALLSDRLQEMLRETVEEGDQAILFLNRRAYSPFLICRDCGHFFMCPRCAVSLSYSRRMLRLRCHHCGHMEVPPESCPKCQGTRLNPFGVGTEKVEEAVADLLPEARVARLDRDVAQRKGALESILGAFAAREIDVLVGTQIVAKGLDFPHVTLVGVVAADVSLSIPDFRAAERTFQLLSQVAGRAGRGQRPGRVIVQTFNPRHMSVVAAQAHDFVSFYEQAIVGRREAGYPPYRKLVNLVFSGAALGEVIGTSEDAAKRLRAAVPDAEVLGPADCPIERVQNRWRKHVLLKLAPEVDVAPIGKVLEGLGISKVQMTIDVDPYSLM